MNNFPPNVNWRWTTALATILGYVVCDDFNAHEQIAIGNWILQIGQTTVSNATYQQMMEARITGQETINLNSREFKCGGSPFIKPTVPPDLHQFYQTFKAQISEEELINLQKAIQKINEELNKMREDLTKK